MLQLGLLSLEKYDLIVTHGGQTWYGHILISPTSNPFGLAVKQFIFIVLGTTCLRLSLYVINGYNAHQVIADNGCVIQSKYILLCTVNLSLRLDVDYLARIENRPWNDCVSHLNILRWWKCYVLNVVILILPPIFRSTDDANSTSKVH